MPREAWAAWVAWAEWITKVAAAETPDFGARPTGCSLTNLTINSSRVSARGPAVLLTKSGEKPLEASTNSDPSLTSNVTAGLARE